MTVVSQKSVRASLAPTHFKFVRVSFWSASFFLTCFFKVASFCVTAGDHVRLAYFSVRQPGPAIAHSFSYELAQGRPPAGGAGAAAPVPDLVLSLSEEHRPGGEAVSPAAALLPARPRRGAGTLGPDGHLGRRALRGAPARGDRHLRAAPHAHPLHHARRRGEQGVEPAGRQDGDRLRPRGLAPLLRPPGRMGDPGGRGLGGGGNGAGLRGGLRQRPGDAHPSPLRHLRGRRGAEPVSAAGGSYAGPAPSSRSRTVRTSSAAAGRQRPFWRRFSMTAGL